MEMDRVSWAHRPTELGAINGREENQLAGMF